MAQTNETNETKRIPAITMEFIPEGNVAMFKCADGEVKGINIDNLTPEIQRAALIHGLKQKVIDAAAISRNPETGKSATVADKWVAAMEVAERLVAGQWNAVREGGGGNEGGLLAAALVKVYNKPIEKIREFLATKSDAEKAALRGNPKIAPVIAEIKAAQAATKAKGVDTSALLGELDQL